MKMETVSNFDLLKFYIHATCPFKDLLVADLNDVEFDVELTALYEQLNNLGCVIPQNMILPGWLIVEMNQCVAKTICNKFDHGFTRIYVFSEGKCVHENF